jgi:ribonucleotide monophosphatase NagD (HAD superfamily)
MAAILLDVDGVLHVSGDPIPGAVDAVRRLRDEGHRLRFVTNSTTMPRSELAGLLRTMGFTLEDDELQTTGGVASRVLAGKRVLALTMPGILDDLEGMQLIGMNADASTQRGSRRPCSASLARRTSARRWRGWTRTRR